MNWFDIRITFPSALVRSYLDFLLSFDYPHGVLIPFKVIAKDKQNKWYFKYPLSTKMLTMKTIHISHVLRLN